MGKERVSESVTLCVTIHLFVRLCVAQGIGVGERKIERAVQGHRIESI